MVDALGDTGHSRFMTPEMYKNEITALNGSFEGIGAYVDNKNGHNVIVAPMEDSPALKAGVAPGDIILKVDGVDVEGLALQDVIKKIIGPAGTQVTITLGSPTTGKLRDVTITRAKIIVKNVTWSMIPGTTFAHVHIAQFSQGVTNQLKDALTALKSQGVTGLILDLRNDPGGLLNEAVGVASQFLKSGIVLQEKDAAGNIRTTPVLRGGAATDIPLVVLINAGSASASEIVAGAIQDGGRAPLIGQKTFGTGTVLSTFPLANNSAMLLATQEWLTPNGRSIWHEGITPDQAVTLDSTVSLLLPSALKSMTPAELLASPDVQLLKALSVLPAGQ
jgi:carboxyl-terminal processing protease